MDIIIRRQDIYITVLILVAFGAWVAWSLHDNRVMQEELEALAQQHIDEWFEGGTEPIDRSAYDYLAIVDSEKAFTLFGRGWGVVHTYFREKGDADFKTFKGIEFFYVREDGAWKMHDSAGCGAFEHHLRAFDAFLAQGVDVPEKVYSRALGVDFDLDLAHLRASAHADKDRTVAEQADGR